MAALVTLLRLLRRTVALRAPFGLFLFPQWIARWTIYPLSGRRAWWPGYEVARHQRVYATLNDPDLMRRFAQNAPLPPGYGTRLDERVVEYPWVLARLGPDAHDLLDAGSTLNWPYLLDHPLLREKRIALLTLAPELWYLPDHRLSYLFGDLRETRLRSGAFDAVTCISTIEHIGFAAPSRDGQRGAFDRPDEESGAPNERDPAATRAVMAQFRKALKPGGRV
ncbi:MAG: hypothetical protein ACFB51_01595, partial [Anaerolineae bacterium]